MRFGHLVPAYVTGAVYVLETGPENKDKLFKYIQSDYVYGYYSQQASCRGNLTLLYIRMMFGESEYKQKLGIKTRESFQLTNDQQRLGEYCASDPELCDRLLRVDRGNEGLCVFAVAECAQRNRGGGDLMASCKTRPKSAFACLKFAFESSDQIRCSDAVAAALCPVD